MRRVLPVLIVLVACGDAHDPANVTLAPSLVFPRGILDGVTRVTVKVYEPQAGLDCNATTGQLTKDAQPFLTKDLATTLNGGPCPSGGKFCGDLSIAKSDSERLFQARAASATSDDVADGCAKTVVNQDALPLKIVMIRNVPPSVCGNRKVEATEQCDPPDGGICDA